MAPVNERVKKHREKLKTNPEKWEEHKKKERDRDKLRRLKQKEEIEKNPRMKAISRRKINERVKAHRERKKISETPVTATIETDSPIGSFKCPQSFGKAVKRIKNTLPNSPSKKAAVLKKLVTDVMGSDVLVSPPRKKQMTDKYLENKACAIQFFCRDDISYQAPGIRDVITVRKKGQQKVKIQKRYMIMTVGEAYEEFKKSYPDMNIGKSLFYSLRPEHVFLVANTPHEVCVCKYHLNFIQLLESVNKDIPTIPKSHNDLFKQVCCNVDSEECMFGLCGQCNTNLDKLIPVDTDLTKETHWKQWGDNDNGRPVLLTHSGTLGQSLNEIMERLPKFKTHCYIKKVQSTYFEKCKTEIAEGEAVIQLDFAENYSLVSQDEIQSAHWSHSQVTLFTCCVWLPKDVVHSYVVVSNDKSHSKYSVYTFLKAILEDVRILHPQIHKICYIFFDNCAGQFKSKFTLSNLCFFKKDFNLEVEWNFFSSSHGKGAMDGIGGTVKRNVWTGVKSRTVNISNAKEFHDYVDQIFNTKIKSLYIDKAVVKENENFLNKRWENVNAIVGVQSCHHFRPYDNNDLLIAKTATSLMTRVCLFSPDEVVPEVKRRLKYSEVYSDSGEENEGFSELDQCEFQEKDFVVIVYEGELFPGQVTEVKEENNCRMFRVQCMTRSGPNWKWPVPPDEMLYARNDICKKIDSESVIPVSNRGVYKVLDPVLEAAWSKFQ